MTQPINLNRARKARAKLQSRAQADANAVKFGRTKAEKTVDAATRENDKSKLDQHQVDE